nr:hypothetical protein CFP56_74508 [Quercus suber]
MDEVLSEWKKLSLTAEEGKSPYTTVSSLGDGLGGVTTQTSENKNRAEEESLLVTSQGGPAPEQFSNAQSNVDLPQASHMDTADFMEDLVQISRPTISPIKRPSNVHPRIESQVVTGFEDMKVSTLIDLATKKWDSNMLNGLFITQEAELISSIPLCPSSEGCYCLAFYPIRDMGKAGLGFVIQGSRGQALASLFEQASLPFSPEIVEAMAIARAISFA